MSRVEKIQKYIEDLEKQTQELQKDLEKQTQELQKELEFEKNKYVVDYPFQVPDSCWRLELTGVITKDWWSNNDFERQCYRQGNIFKTEEEAEKEQARRELLMLFKQYRDKCNGGWKPNFIDFSQNKYSMRFDYYSNKLEIFASTSSSDFRLFGYFRKKADLQRAIELFGDEIKRLFVEE